MLVTLKEIQSEKFCFIRISPLSVHWKFFLFILDNPNCVPHNIFFDLPKTDSCQNDAITKELKIINNKNNNDILIPILPCTNSIF